MVGQLLPDDAVAEAELLAGTLVMLEPPAGLEGAGAEGALLERAGAVLERAGALLERAGALGAEDWVEAGILGTLVAAQPQSVTVTVVVTGGPDRQVELAGAGVTGVDLAGEEEETGTDELGTTGVLEGVIDDIGVEEATADEEAPAPEPEQESAVRSTFLHWVTEVLLVV